jgi:hypothetical protein
MRPKFDIFKRLRDGTSLWILAVEGLEEARNRMNRLAVVVPGDYLIYSEEKGLVVTTGLSPRTNVSRKHIPVAQRVSAHPLPGEEYGESKYPTESDWFARGFCHDSDADRNLEPSRDQRLMQILAFSSRWAACPTEF